MPFPLLAHQVVVVPLKTWRPRWFDGTALVVGSLAPDLQNFTSMARTEIGHSLRGQFIFCLPITMIVVVWMGGLRLGDVFASRFGARAAWLAGAATGAMSVVGFLRAIASALIGSFSHIGLDALTHRVLPRLLPRGRFHVGRITFGAHAIVQIVVSLILAALFLVLLRRFVPRDVPVPTKRSGAALIVVFAFLGGVVGALHAVPAVKHPDWYFQAGPVYVWGFVGFLVIAGAAFGALVGATPLALRDR